MTDAKLVRSLEIILGCSLSEAVLDRPINEIARGTVSRTALMTALTGASGGRVDGYLLPTSSLRDALHWIGETTSHGKASTRGMAAPVRLRPIDNSDVPQLYRGAMDPNSGYRWRYRGATVGLDEFTHSLFNGVISQFVVADVEDGEMYGLVTAYNAQLDQGHAYIGTYRTSARRSQGEMMFGCLLLITHLFRTFPLRKLYAEVPGYNEAVLGLSQSPMFRQEGSLRQHYFYGGKWWDLDTFAVYRDEWFAFVHDAIDPFVGVFDASEVPAEASIPRLSGR